MALTPEFGPDLEVVHMRRAQTFTHLNGEPHPAGAGAVLAPP